MKCIDLRPWAEKNRYRWRYEESSGAQMAQNEEEAPWYVEVICEHGLIYPKGEKTLLAYSSAGKKKFVAAIPGAEHHQHDGNNQVFRFPVEQLYQVAAILKPRKKRVLDSDRARTIGKATAFLRQS